MVEVVEGLQPGEVVIAPADAQAKLEAGRETSCAMNPAYGRHPT